MPRLETILGVFSALLFVFALALTPAAIPVPLPAETLSASSTIAELTSGTSLPPLTLPALAGEASATATDEVLPTSLPAEIPLPRPAPEKKAPIAEAAPAAAPAPPPALPPSPSGDLDRTSAKLRAALVNIICYVPAGSRLHSISGSGIIVDPKGIILTNAHIAQYYLLAEEGVSCTIRSGSPAVDRYKAALLYLPASWIRANARVLTEFTPSGTGEEDFALLGITKSVTSTPLPATFPSVPPALVSPRTGEEVVIASYGAQFLQSNQVQSALFPTIVFGSVKELYTFDTTTPDVLALGGSAAAQEGSSGGGVATAAGELGGTITTSTITGATDTRELNAITLSYIRNAYANEAGESFETLLVRPISESAALFAPQISGLEALLTANL